MQIVTNEEQPCKVQRKSGCLPAADAASGSGSTRKLEIVAVNRLKPHPRNARTHSRKQIRKIADSIQRFGFNNPVLIDDGDGIIAGHGRVEAAKLLGFTAVPSLRLSHLSETEKRAYILADNRLAQEAGWDKEILAIELHGLIDLDFEVELTGFDTGEIEIVLDATDQAEREGADKVPDPLPDPAVSQPGDLWMLGSHQLICGRALDGAANEADFLIRRWQTYTGKWARLAATGQTFEEVERVPARSASPPSAIAANDAAAAEEVR